VTAYTPKTGGPGERSAEAEARIASDLSLIPAYLLRRVAEWRDSSWPRTCPAARLPLIEDAADVLWRAWSVVPRLKTQSATMSRRSWSAGRRPDVG
jgi:hypothetical protein